MANGDRPAITAEGTAFQLPDIDPAETQEWLESFDGLLDSSGQNRARFVMLKLLDRARQRQVGLPSLRSSDYINTIAPEDEPWFPPGDEEIERKIRRAIRWNAAIMVSKANRKGLEVGGHIATYASAASLYEVGYNHFFRGKDHPRRRRPHLRPGARGPRHLRPLVPARPVVRPGPRRVPPGAFPGGPARRPVLLSAPPARCRPSGSSRRCRWASAR